MCLFHLQLRKEDTPKKYGTESKKRIIWTSSRFHVNSRSHNVNQECDNGGIRIGVFFFTSVTIECLVMKCSFSSRMFPSWPKLSTCFACLMLINSFAMICSSCVICNFTGWCVVKVFRKEKLNPALYLLPYSYHIIIYIYVYFKTCRTTCLHMCIFDLFVATFRANASFQCSSKYCSIRNYQINWLKKDWLWI